MEPARIKKKYLPDTILVEVETMKQALYTSGRLAALHDETRQLLNMHQGRIDRGVEDATATPKERARKR